MNNYKLYLYNINNYLQRKNRKIILAIALGLLSTIIISTFTGFMNDCEEIRHSVFRLHILANSDSKQDQYLKLKVRDKILEQTQDLFTNVKSSNDAKKIANENLENIINIAQQEVYNQGYNYKVNAYVCNMFFDTRDYETFSLPAGMYDALRITIGDANGKNWWCVLYPSMCLQTSQPKENLENSTLDKSQIDIIENPQEYKARFKIVEIYESIKNFIVG